MDAVVGKKFGKLESGVQVYCLDNLERPEHYRAIISENGETIPREMWVEYERHKGMIDRICGVGAGREFGNEKYDSAMDYVKWVMGI